MFGAVCILKHSLASLPVKVHSEFITAFSAVDTPVFKTSIHGLLSVLSGISPVLWGGIGGRLPGQVVTLLMPLLTPVFKELMFEERLSKKPLLHPVLLVQTHS